MVYVFNIKFLPLRGEGMTFFLVNVVPFLNLGARRLRARVGRGAVHLPGREPRGTHVLAAALEPDVDARAAVVEVLGRARCRCSCSRSAIVGVTDCAASGERRSCSLVSVLHDHVHDARAGGTGARLRNDVPAVRDGERGADPDVVRRVGVHDELRRADRSASIVLEARPVYAYLSAQAFGEPTRPIEMIVGFGLAAVVCGVATLVPIEMALAGWRRRA